MNNKYKQPGINLWNCPKHWFNNAKLIPCSCNRNPICKLCHGYGYIRETNEKNYTTSS